MRGKIVSALYGWSGKKHEPIVKVKYFGWLPPKRYPAEEEKKLPPIFVSMGDDLSYCTVKDYHADKCDEVFYYGRKKKAPIKNSYD